MSLVLITGGAGNLGRAVARLLSAKDYLVRVFDLPEVDYGFAAGHPHIEVCRGSLLDRDVLASACVDAEWVIHLAAVMPPLSEQKRDLAQAVNVEGTRRVLECMRPDSRLIFASSVATYGVAEQEIVALEHPQRPIDWYGETKLQNERDIRAGGKPAAILRISGISVPALLEIPHPWFFSRDQKVEFIHLHDAAAAVAACVDNSAALGGTWLIAGGPNWRTTGQAYSDAICSAFETPAESATFLNRPGWPAWFDTTASEALLHYQQHSFDGFTQELRELYREAVA